MSIPREEHDAKIDALEARVYGRTDGLVPLLQAVREDIRETRVELRERFRFTISINLAILIAVVSAGVGLYQATVSSVDSIISAYVSGKSSQPQIHVVPHPVATSQE